MKDFYTVAEMAQLLEINESSLRTQLYRPNNGLPPSIRIKRRIRFPVAEYERWKSERLREMKP